MFFFLIKTITGGSVVMVTYYIWDIEFSVRVRLLPPQKNTNMKKLKFNREENNRWYVDLPDWTGSKADLEMVYGADTMLDYFAEGENSVWLYIGDEYFENSDVLTFERMATEIENGAFYVMRKYRGIELNLDVYLCDVTLFVLGKFPDKIYLGKLNF